MLSTEQLRRFGYLIEPKAAPELSTPSAEEGTFAHALAQAGLYDPEWERWLSALAQQSRPLQPNECAQPSVSLMLNHAPQPRSRGAQWKREQRS